VLAVRITRNHALPDGNKRLAWQALTLSVSSMVESCGCPSKTP
jgi:hypothetical protein